MPHRRTSGVLAHISTLPGNYGIGTLGKESFDFCDFLAGGGFSEWQMLPINPQGPGFSPYNSISTFAGNPLLISPEALFEDGLISRKELEAEVLPIGGRVDYKIVIARRANLLRLAFSRFSDFSALEAFCEEEKKWLCDYASFMTIREELGGIAWQHFPNGLRTKEDLASWQEAHKADEYYYKFEQFMFFSQWKKLRKYAKEHGISLIGDVPICVSLDSCDVWSSPEIFNLSESLLPIDVAGCPPDVFSPEGQLWGNPTYRWDTLSQNGFSWWISRLSHCSRLFDTVRLDHFRAFESYWAVPYGAQNAIIGEWKKGPGKAFFDAIRRELPTLDMIAEDLGFLTEDVLALRDAANLPGMRILQFAFDGDGENLYLPHKYPENCVVYTGTHDNDTLRGFIESAPHKKLEMAEKYLNPTGEETLSDAFIRAAVSSKANRAIVPIQDFLYLPSSARMNTPSTVNDQNWRFRIPADALSTELSRKLFDLNRKHNRI